MKSNLHIDPEMLQRYADGRCSPEEKVFIDTWFIYFKTKSPQLDLDEATLNADLQEVWGKLDRHVQNSAPTMVRWKKWLSIAASLLILAGAYYSTIDNADQKDNPTIQNLADKSEHATPARIKHAKIDIPAAQRGAVLILSSGEKVYLNGREQRESRMDHQVDIDLSSSEQISYKAKSGYAQHGSLPTNSIIVPPGSVYNVVLADGTKVSLNADSKLTFPVAFDGSKREVFLEGEAYFEVTRRKVYGQSDAESQSFIVHVGAAAVNVLGTKFNVKAYRGDNKHSFTLEEGSIALSLPSVSAPLLLKPGQQALQEDDQLSLREVDIKKELSWKYGDFYFNGETIQEIMTQIGRWYAIDIHYMGAMNDQQYISTISRRKSLKEVLEILETTTGLKFSIQQHDKERRLMVIP